jgi:hypothetical protein
MTCSEGPGFGRALPLPVPHLLPRFAIATTGNLNGEMELATTTEKRDAIGSGAGRGPLENPVIEEIPNDPLLEPHPDEPGVKGDGGAAAPLENPGARP